MQNEILITKREDKLLTIRTEGKRIVQIDAEDIEEESVLGNIYVGKVRNVVKNINAAFVEFQKGQMGYLSLAKGICPIHTDGVHHQDDRVLIGDEIIIQVQREASKTKPPTLSGEINIAGKYMVLVRDGGMISISSKIKDKEKREWLYEIMERYATDEIGFIARTNSADETEENIVAELEKLVSEYKKISEFGKHKTIFSCLKHTPRNYIKSIVDARTEYLSEIVTDCEDVYNEIHEYCSEYDLKNKEKLRMWNPLDGKLDAVYNVSRTLEHALMQRVWLKSGAYIIIQPTEALVSIDVNTGKAISKKKDVQKTFLKVNLEAAKEIAYQLRLRNLSGMILIDFIDMKDEENNQLLMETLKEECSKDGVKTSVVDMTKLGLVEVTRKKTRKTLYEQLHGQDIW